MKPRARNRRWIPALALALFASACVTAPMPEWAQPGAAEGNDGGRFRVLVPTLEPAAGADAGFGQDVASALRERIDTLATHTSVTRREFQGILGHFDVTEEELDCVKTRQIAIQSNIELVMCGTYEPAGGEEMQVSARFISSETGEAFEVEPFTAASAEAASERIFTSFERYVNQIRLTAFCYDYLNSEAWQRALDNCEQALEISPESEPALYGKARALLGMADALDPTSGEDITEVAVSEVEEQADAAPTTPVNGRRGELLTQSLDILQRVLEINPVNQDAMLTAGIVAAKLNRQELARGYFNEYLELNPGSVDVRLRVAIDLAEAGDPEGALRIAEEGLAEDSANLTLQEYAGHFALNAAKVVGEEDPERATEFYEAALEYYQAVFEERGAEVEPRILRNVVLSYIELERFDEAADFGERVVETHPDNADLWFVYAKALREAGRLDAAFAALDSVVAIDADYPNLYATQGLWLVQAGQTSRARDAFRTAVERGAESDRIARAIFGFGYNERYKNGQNDAALDLFALATEFAATPVTRAMTNFWQGWILFQRGRQLQEPQTAAAAQQALPVFERAREFFQASGPYAETQASVNLQQIMSAVNQYIEIQQLLIQRGR